MLVSMHVQEECYIKGLHVVGTLLSCSEAWYNLSEADLGHLEKIDKALWCNLLEVARTVPYDLVFCELALEPL